MSKTEKHEEVRHIYHEYNWQEQRKRASEKSNLLWILHQVADSPERSVSQDSPH